MFSSGRALSQILFVAFDVQPEVVDPDHVLRPGFFPVGDFEGDPLASLAGQRHLLNRAVGSQFGDDRFGIVVDVEIDLGDLVIDLVDLDLQADQFLLLGQIHRPLGLVAGVQDDRVGEPPGVVGRESVGQIRRPVVAALDGPAGLLAQFLGRGQLGERGDVGVVDDVLEGFFIRPLQGHPAEHLLARVHHDVAQGQPGGQVDRAGCSAARVPSGTAG